MNSPIGFILGSGWGGIIEKVKDQKESDFKTVFGQSTTVIGHAGKIVTGSISDKNVIILSGRFHTYEGYTSDEATKTVRYLHDQRVKKIIITSASGGLNPEYKVGELVILNDIISLFCQSPLSGMQFQNLSKPFSPEMKDKALKAANHARIPSQNGVYVYMKGPHFESFADKKALRILGADVVGMSTVPEVIMANHLGMDVLGLSLVTNLAFVEHSHKEVLNAAKNQEKSLKKFFLELIKII